jgi:hypothetical protein
MSATYGGRLGENFGDLGGRAAWAGRKIVEFFGTHLQGSVCGGKCFAAAAKKLPPINSSASRFLQREIVFFPRGFRVLAYQSSGLTLDSHARLQIVPYTAAIEVLS